MTATASTVSSALPAKRPRGRPSKASLAAAVGTSRDSVSSITTSNSSESVSGYSTPFTSNAATPADSNRQSKLEVVIPVVKPRDAAAKAMQQAKDYMMGIDSKKKRNLIEIADGEDDNMSDSSPITRRTRNDEQVARQLQDNFDQEAAEAFVSEVDDDTKRDQMNDDSDDFAIVNPKRKGKSVAQEPRRRAAATVAAQDSEEEEGYSDTFDFEPPAKKRKTAISKGKGKGKGKAKAKASSPPASIFSSSDDDIPGEWLSIPGTCPD